MNRNFLDSNSLYNTEAAEGESQPTRYYTDSSYYYYSLIIHKEINNKTINYILCSSFS